MQVALRVAALSQSPRLGTLLSWLWNILAILLGWSWVGGSAEAPSEERPEEPLTVDERPEEPLTVEVRPGEPLAGDDRPEKPLSGDCAVAEPELIAPDRC